MQERSGCREASGKPFDRMNEYRQTERLQETAARRFNDLLEDQAACYRLIERCRNALKAPHSNGIQLILAGTTADANIAFEETASELLQLSGVCQDAEIFPDLDPGKAVYRRSQVYDALRAQAGLPPVFLRLSERENNYWSLTHSSARWPGRWTRRIRYQASAG